MEIKTINVFMKTPQKFNLSYSKKDQNQIKKSLGTEDWNPISLSLNTIDQKKKIVFMFFQFLDFRWT